MRKLRTALFGILCGLQAFIGGGFAGELVPDGILGQSCPAGVQPFAFAGPAAVKLSGSRLWIASGERLCALRSAPLGEWIVESEIRLPSPARPRGLLEDGGSLYVLSADNVLRKARADGVLEKMASLERGCVSAAFSREAKGNLYLLFPGGVLKAISNDGRVVKEATRLELGEEAAKLAKCLDVSPDGDSLWVGTGYPDCGLYRFNPDGSLNRSGGWPRHFGSHGVVQASIGASQSAAITDHGSLHQWLAVPGRSSDNVVSTSLPWTMYGVDLQILPDGSFAVASSQGLLFLDRFARPLNRRIGGLPNVSALGISPDGEILASFDNGARLASLLADDAPDAAISGIGSQAWRAGGAQDGIATAIQPFDGRFLVLDGKAGRLWSFDQAKAIEWGDKPWIPLTPAGAFAKPSSLAAGDTFMAVLDGERILMSNCGLTSFGAIELPLPGKPTAIAANGDDLLAVCAGGAAFGFERASNGSFVLRWQSSARFGEISSAAANCRYVALCDSAAGRIAILRAEDGQLIAQRELGEGLLRPEIGALSLRGAWLFAAVKAKCGILRFKIDDAISIKKPAPAP